MSDVAAVLLDCGHPMRQRAIRCQSCGFLSCSTVCSEEHRALSHATTATAMLSGRAAPWVEEAADALAARLVSRYIADSEDDPT